MNQFLKNHRKEVGMTALLLILCIWTAVGSDGRFLSPINISNLLRQVGLFGIFSMGMGLVIISSGIDLSVGSLMSLLGVIFFYTLTGSSPVIWIPELSWPLGLLLVVGVSLIIGFIYGLLIGKYKMQAFIITLCGLLSYRGLSRYIAEDTSVGYIDSKQNLDFLYSACSGSISLGTVKVPMAFIYMLIIAAIMFVVLHKSVFGRYLYAVGRNEEATKYSGINTNKIIIAVYMISCLLTAISAILFSFYTSSITPSVHANFYELYAIAAAVLGGCSLRGGEGSIYGIIVGTIILLVIQNMINLLGYPSSLADAITGLVIFFGVLSDEVLSTKLLSFFKRKA
ncbi:ABC transporter permease [Lentisphaera profundi]|uniref:ABC transporter permease n=1 Tax=Lentisphaera profundi TaxID=1658616 RepID=A0ABY7VPQ7_9BACT|nr:ABC transporter permease [Lentisphaera profundi]WDE95704.1 ABC transporter permease [Lentisphaera profundi]